MVSNRRIDFPENVGGPASCGSAERLGPHQCLRPLATADSLAAPLSREDVNPGTGETGPGARGVAYPRGLTHARAASTADTMHQGETKP